MIKIMVLISLILLTGCIKQPLNLKVWDMIKSDCECNSKECICMDKYGDGVIYLSCDNKELFSMTDILMECNYGYRTDEEQWERFPNKFEVNINGT